MRSYRIGELEFEEDCFQFQEAVKLHVLPLVNELYEAKKKNRTMAFFIARTCGLCVDCSFPNASNYWLQLYGLEWNRRKNICRLEKLQPNAVR